MIYCLIGQSSSGKSTIERRLEAMGFPRIVSYTTRPIRDGETNGVDYYFIDEEAFKSLDRLGRFAETAQYRDWNYGLSLDGIDYRNKKYIVVVTVHGYKELVKAVGKDNVTAIHIQVDEATRMYRQVERGDDVDEIIRRIHTDRDDFSEAEEICDYIVENKSLDWTLVEVYNIISAK